MELLNDHIIALWLGFLLDKLLGDPFWLPHPVVAFGKTIAFCERKLNSGQHRIFKGTLAAVFLVTATFTFFFSLMAFVYRVSPVVGVIAEVVFVFFGLAGTTLVREGKAVFRALEKGLDEGRKQLSRIVGRDTQSLNKNEVQAATLETLAENLSDGVIAPLFWFALAGIPGMMAYKMVNTLDSMIGYKNEKYLHFGRFAAWLDDVTNFFPARITAFLMAVCSSRARAFRFLFKYGRAHSSPNAGYPEAALAGALNVTFGGTHLYFGEWVPKPVIGETKRDFNENDLKYTVKIVRRTEFVFMLLFTIAFTVLTFYF